MATAVPGGHAAGSSGDRETGRRWLNHWYHLGRGRYLSPYHLALAHVGLGEHDEAFASLGPAAADRDPALTYVAVERRFSPLRSDPRYSPLMGRLGLTSHESAS